MKNYKFLITIILGFTTLAYGQDPKLLPEIIPPSPEAAAFAKFAETPVSHYTGLPNISVPFHSIDLDGMNIPIGLSYHARGIKVEEIASRVGIGWTLNAGGAVTRQTRGSSDELPYYGYLNLNTYSNFFTSRSSRSSAYNGLLNYSEYDMIPDKFQVQAPGLSATFFFNQQTGEPLLKSYDDLDINYTLENGKIAKFIIKNSNGYIYYFGKSQNGLREAFDYDDVTHSYSFSQSGSLTTNSDDSYIVYNSWKLMDIVSPNGESVSFSYNEEYPIFHRRSYDKLNMDTNQAICYFNRVESKQYQLHQIDASNTRVKFIKGSERLDLDDAFPLSSVEVYQGTTNLIKSFDLNYTYSDCEDDNNQLAYLKTVEPRADKRLMLNSVTEKGINGSIKPSYFFEYNSNPLPNRFSNSQDYWGYYNDTNNGRFLTFFDYGTTGIDRSVDTIASRAGMLEKITYPTGGYTVFTYEHNKAKPTGNIEDLFFSNTNPATIENKNVGLSQLDNIDRKIYYLGSYQKPFTVSSNIDGSVSSNISFADNSGCSSTTYGYGCKFRVFIKQGSLTVAELFMGQDQLTLQPGDYTFVVTPQGTHDPYNMNDAFLASLSWTEISQASVSEILYTSGKRIKRIDTYDADQSLVSFKEYEYKRSNGDCSGAVLGMPSFYSIDQTMSPDGSVVLMPDGAVPGSPMSTAQGNSIGYGMVTEYFGDKNNNVGKTEYEFSLTKDNQGYMKYPYHIPNDNEWLRGLPLKVRQYRKESNGSYSLVKDVVNNYLYAGIVPQSSLGGEGLMLSDESPEIHPHNSDEIGPSSLFLESRFRFPLAIFYNAEEYWEPDSGTGIMYKAFFMTGGTVDKVSTTETSYDGASNHVKTTEYDFNYSNHYQVASVLTDASDLDPLIQKFVYTKDLINTTPAEEDLLFQNRVVPIEIRQYKDLNGDKIAQSSELLSYVKNTYKSIGLKKAELDFVSVAKGPNALEPRVRYHSYDSSGNPLEVSKEDGAHIVYLWGYNDQHPIAKIENATSTEVMNQLSGHSGLEYYDESDMLQINNLRMNLPNAMVTTYEYEPLVGVTKITDPRAQVTTYHYDNFNRLEFIKDQLGNLVQENQYNYKN
ncbi:hypothetical protein MKO06_15390 [Gramella sp. GC03-9]|uniref:YD repeat-containing protein n=1 Tax=Christiangramia oceanisediminis TaxID=2920386 RepID=A0A9X2RA83_9FLAO|nr:hypothetical protein [Gramella oceanisediminis]MCP9201292.1 hypothetical protein [Gramella oceanisediminis]